MEYEKTNRYRLITILPMAHLNWNSSRCELPTPTSVCPKTTGTEIDTTGHSCRYYKWYK